MISQIKGFLNIRPAITLIYLYKSSSFVIFHPNLLSIFLSLKCDLIVAQYDSELPKMATRSDNAPYIFIVHMTWVDGHTSNCTRLNTQNVHPINVTRKNLMGAFHFFASCTNVTWMNRKVWDVRDFSIVDLFLYNNFVLSFIWNHKYLNIYQLEG